VFREGELIMKFGKSTDRLKIEEKTKVEDSVYSPPTKDETSPPIMKIFSPKTGTVRSVSKGALGGSQPGSQPGK
jgi:hypothetical protein